MDVKVYLQGDRMGDTMAAVADLDRDIQRGIKDLCNQQKQAAKIIDTLSDPRQRYQLRH